MRRLSLILVLAVLVGGVPVWNAHAGTAHPAVHSSLLLAQAAVQPPPGLFSGIASAIDNFVNSIVGTVKAAFGFVTRPVPKPPKGPAPTVGGPHILESNMPGSEEGKKGFGFVTRPVPKATEPEAPMLNPPESNMPGSEEEKAGFGFVTTPKPVTAPEKKGSFSLFPASNRPSGEKSATKAPAKSSPVNSSAATATAGSSPAKSSQEDVLKYADVNAAKVPASTTAVAPSAVKEQPREVPQSAPVAQATASNRADSSSAQAPLLYSQPYAALPTTSRPAPATAPVVTRPVETRPIEIRPVETRPVTPPTREPVAAMPRFIDTIILPTILPTREPERPITEAEERAAAAATEVPTVAERDATLPERITVEVRPVTEPPATTEETRVTETDGTPLSDTTTVEEPPAMERPATIILSNARDNVIVQTMGSSTLYIVPTTGNVVACTPEVILSLGEGRDGVTRGIVMGDGTVLITPAGYVSEFVRSEGKPYAFDTVPKVCNLRRLFPSDLILDLPRGLTNAKTVVGTDGVVFTAAADADRIIRKIVVRQVGPTAAESRVVEKMIPERNQPQTIRNMTVNGVFPGPFTVQFDGTACEFSSDTDMTCTTRGTL